jgi:hypothetical protein
MMADVTTYTYTGNDFTIATAPFTTSDSVTGSFTAATLDANLVNASNNLDVYSWNFTDGPDIFTGSYSVIGNVSTDASGAIEEWYVLLGKISRPFCVIEGSSAGDQCESGSGLGEVLHESGSWTMVTYQTPEPSALALFGTGILGLAGMARRRLLPICRARKSRRARFTDSESGK